MNDLCWVSQKRYEHYDHLNSIETKWTKDDFSAPALRPGCNATMVLGNLALGMVLIFYPIATLQ